MPQYECTGYASSRSSYHLICTGKRPNVHSLYPQKRPLHLLKNPTTRTWLSQPGKMAQTKLLLSTESCTFAVWVQKSDKIWVFLSHVGRAINSTKITFRTNFGVFLTALLAGKWADIITLISFGGESKGCLLSPGMVRQDLWGAGAPCVGSSPCGEGGTVCRADFPKGPHCTSPVQEQMQFPIPGIFPGWGCDVTRPLELLPI